MAESACPIWLNNSWHAKHQSPRRKAAKTINCTMEELLEQARKDYKLGIYKTVKAATDAYKVSYPTLVRRVNGQTRPKYIMHKHQLALTTEEEEVLVDCNLDGNLICYVVCLRRDP